LAPSDGWDVNHSAREQSAGTPHVQLTWRERLPDASDDDMAEPEITVTLERPDSASLKMVGTHVHALRVPCKPRRPKLKDLVWRPGAIDPRQARVCVQRRPRPRLVFLVSQSQAADGPPHA